MAHPTAPVKLWEHRQLDLNMFAMAFRTIAPVVPGRRPSGTATRRGLHGRRGKHRVDEIHGGVGGLNAAAHHRRVVHPVGERSTRQLSGGERQRVAVGRAFMNQPDLVLIDEPTSALDTKLGEQVMELIVTEVRARDTPAVIVTHDMRMTHYADITLNIVDGILGDAATS